MIFVKLQENQMLQKSLSILIFIKMKKHKTSKKFKRCLCFKKYDADYGFTTFASFRTLLLVMKRMGIPANNDIKMLLYRKYIGSPMNYFCYRNYIHSVYNVRKNKDTLKRISKEFRNQHELIEMVKVSGICLRLAFEYLKFSLHDTTNK
jgi:hypothetical protein